MNEIPGQYLSNPIYNYLKDAILTGELSPGEQITEIRIAKKFNSSRTPVRDAFRALAENGLLIINPNKSVKVAYYDNNAIDQLGIMRLQLDLLAAKLAIHYGSNSNFLTLKEIATQCFNMEISGEHIKAIGLDADFHLSLAETSRNIFIYEMQQSIWLRTQFILANGKRKMVDYNQRIKLHFDIVDALIERNEERTLLIIKEHNFSKILL